jgi:HSP20 family molecular chaperone IbpA
VGDLRREIDRLFEAAITGRPFGFGGESPWTPSMDVEETEDKLRLTFEVPGVNADDLSVTVDNDVLTVSGEKRRATPGGRTPRLAGARVGRPRPSGGSAAGAVAMPHPAG